MFSPHLPTKSITADTTCTTKPLVFIRVHSSLKVIVALLLFVMPTFFASAAEDTAWHSDLQLGGCGGLYLLAGPGELWVEIEKADRNRSDREIHLRAIFFGPDRAVIDEGYVPDDGQPSGSGAGPVQRIRFSTQVTRTGVYGVALMATNDRYGTEFIWGFTTNCPKYLVETSRGHKDERHQEPIILYSGETAGEVCFMPRPGPIQIDLSGLPAGGEMVCLRDGAGAMLGEAAPDQAGSARFSIQEDNARGVAPWTLHLSACQGTVHIDGVTRWDGDDGGSQNLSLWTPEAHSWFPFHENRWLLTPYRQRRNVKPGGEGTARFEVHNNGHAEKSVALAIDFADAPWPCTLSTDSVSVAPGKSAWVELAYRMPEDHVPAVAHLRATTDGFSTWSTLELTPDTGQLDQPIEMPIVLTPYRHENAQFGYAPDYPLTNQVYFDRENRPVVTSDTGVSVLQEGAWKDANLGHLGSSKVAFDGDNDMYVLARDGGTPALAHSQDGGATFTSYPIPGSANIDLEQFSGHNAPAGPPPIARNTLTERDPDHIWRHVNTLDLFLPAKHADGAIAVGEPIRISDKCIGLSSHSGIPSTIVSRGDKVHVVWAEATDPEEKVPGVPTFVATYDRAASALSKPALVGYGPPANDVHNTPSITMDSQGYLHVLVGTHGRTFLYARSLQPDDAGGGWTEPEPLGPGLRQTYVGFVCDQNDTLHVVFRLWNADTEYFPAGAYASLSYMHKAPGEAWSDPQPLIVSAFSEYSVFYHRLTIDRQGALFLSYDYWSTFWCYRTDRRETRRALMTSPDGGQHWKLATMTDLSR